MFPSLQLEVVGQDQKYRWPSVRTTYQFGLGGGGSGFEGEYGGSFTGGVRIPLGRRHGPIARVGFGGHVLGNDRFYSSRIEVPRFELGYQILSGMVFVEAAGTTGYVIDGRYGQRIPPRIDGQSPHTPLAGFEIGAYLSVHVPYVRLGVSLERVPITDGSSGSVLLGQANACVGYGFAVCGDVRAFGQDGIFGAARSTYYGGITVGWDATGLREWMKDRDVR
jgi:hypothetical protein